MSLFPAGALLIGIIFLIFFPLGKKEVDKLQSMLNVSITSEAKIETKTETETVEN
jgi:hypothetical protein